MTTLEIDAEKVISDAIAFVQKTLMEKPIESEIILKQLLVCVPDHPEALKLLGIVKQKMCQFEDSIAIINRAIELDSECADNYNNLALSYANLDQYEEAIKHLKKALELRPNFPLFMNNLALQYRQIGEYELSANLLKDAIKEEEYPQLWCNLGGVYGELKDLNKARECFLRAIELDSECAPAHVDLAFTYHLEGDWAQGFEHYEWRFEHFHQLQYYKKAFDPAKKWDGELSLSGKRILLYGEQGLGDSIQFIRFVPYLKKLGAYVIVNCAKDLSSIINRCEGVDEVIVKDIVNLDPSEVFPEYDFQCSLMSLPHLLKVYEYSGEPYIKPLSTVKYDEYKDTLNIGIVWAGSPSHPNDGVRSCHLKYFEEISQLEGVKLFNLQVNTHRRLYLNGQKVIDYTAGGEKVKMVDLVPLIHNFEDTAAVIAELDLIICVDTSLVHLAGAMGVPCWSLIQYNPDWRWGLEGDRTVWYDSVRLFRQPNLKDWDSVFKEIYEGILSLLRQRGQQT